MGLFLQTVIIPNCKESVAQAALERVEQNSDFDLVSADCLYRENANGITILLNERCYGYEELAASVSKEVAQPVLLLYIYDEDYWGYYLYAEGEELDCFNPMPDYFEEVSEQERKRVAGNSAVLAKYFDVNEALIKDYLVLWTEERMEDYESKAYEDDEFKQCHCWQMADFMKKLGYPYEW